MLEFLHSAPYLYREDAYADYCWAVDACGAYQPASFIYWCSEAFAVFCEEVGIYVKPSITDIGLNESRAFRSKAQKNGVLPDHSDFDGLIIRITSSSDLALIEKYLHGGKNVLALLPNEWATNLGKEQAHSMINTSSQVLSTLNAEQIIDKLSPSFYNRGTIWWQEIPQAQGRLFVTEDRFISDGLFLEGYGKSAENLLILESLRKELSIFQGNFITITLRNSIDSWLCHEPISLIFNIQNRGKQLEGKLLNLELPESLEPIGATEICLPPMNPLGKTSFALQVIPRLDGEYPNLFNVSCLDSDLRIKVIRSKLIVMPKYSTQVREQSRRDTPSLERLKQFLSAPDTKKWLADQNIDNIEELAAIDTSACLNKIRSVAEQLAQKCTKVSNLRFADQIKRVQEQNLLSKKSIGYFHTVRVLGNLASHPSGESITLDDVRVAAFALSCILEEIITKKISL
jgi:Domain of unknown function (DUF4145)